MVEEMKANWWEDLKEPVAMKIPIEGEKPKQKVRKSCMLFFGAIVLRIVGIAVALAVLFYGGWTFYQIPNHLNLADVVKIIAQGSFLCFLGILAFLAETRTRWTMKGCVDTYILFANYLARGVMYIVLGAIMFALMFDPPYVQRYMLAGGVAAGGILNVFYFPFYWKYQRRLQIARMHQPLEPFPEEIVYGMNVDYIQNTGQPPTIKVTPSQSTLGPDSLGPISLGPTSPVGQGSENEAEVCGAMRNRKIKESRDMKKSREVNASQEINMKKSHEVKVKGSQEIIIIEEEKVMKSFPEMRVPEPLAIGAGAC